MKIIYLGHSGFLAELKKAYCLFDYFEGELPVLDPQKEMYLFFSHKHYDHFNPHVLELLAQQNFPQGRIHSLISFDIAEKDTLAFPDRHILQVGEYSIGELNIRTLPSTDEGLAFLVKTTEGTLYFAGDLNDWVWRGEPDRDNEEMTKRFRKIIDSLSGTSIQIAFIPLDPRQEENAYRGLLYFLDKVGAEKVYPMHYWKKPSIIQRFCRDHPAYKTIIQNTEEAK